MLMTDANEDRDDDLLRKLASECAEKMYVDHFTNI